MTLNCDQRGIFGSDFIEIFNYSMQKYFRKLKKITPKNRPLVIIDGPFLLFSLGSRNIRSFGLNYFLFAVLQSQSHKKNVAALQLSIKVLCSPALLRSVSKCSVFRFKSGPELGSGSVLFSRPDPMQNGPDPKN